MLTIKTTERRHFSSVSIVHFEQVNVGLIRLSIEVVVRRCSSK